MAVRHHVKGYDNFVDFMKKLDIYGKTVYVIFGGSTMPNGKSWCDDCERAHQFIEEAIQKFTDTSSVVIDVEVGDRPYWKDLNCPFRTDSSTRLLVIPSIIVWGTQLRLVGEQCEKSDLLEMLFTEE